MDEAAASTLREIDAAKGRLAADLDTLEARLPPGEEIARRATTAGGALAGLGAVAAIVVMLRRRRAAAAERHRRARANAEEIAKLFSERDPIRATVEHRTLASRSGPWALAAALLALAVSVVQYRRSQQP